MKRFGRVTTVLLIAVCSLAFATAGAFAGCCDEDKDPTKPLGVASDAPGTKLPGVVAIHHMDVQFGEPDPETGEVPQISTTSIITLRLQKGDKDVRIFKTIVDEVDITQSKFVLEIIHEILAPDILEAFFDGQDLRVVLKSIDNLVRTDPSAEPDPDEADEYYILADVVVAVSKKE